MREEVKKTRKEYDKTEDDLKALQSVGQIIGEVLRQLDAERCACPAPSPNAFGNTHTCLLRPMRVCDMHHLGGDTRLLGGCAKRVAPDGTGGTPAGMALVRVVSRD